MHVCNPSLQGWRQENTASWVCLKRQYKTKTCKDKNKEKEKAQKPGTGINRYMAQLNSTGSYKGTHRLLNFTTVLWQLSLAYAWLHRESMKTQATRHSCEGLSWSDSLKHEDLPWIWVAPSGGSKDKKTRKKKVGFCLLALTIAGKSTNPVTVAFLHQH